MKNIFQFLLCSLLFSHMIEILPVAEAYVGGVIPAPLNEEKYDPTLGSRADRLEKSVRLLTVMNLMQQGWELYADHWYKLFDVELMWVSAENFCRELGGHLVSIKDIAENNFVHKLRKKNNVWIGLNKVNSKTGVYGWSDGGKADYHNWDSTQPNEPEVDCVYMAYNQDKDGTWFDYGCSEKLPQYFVCKMQM